MLDDPGGPPDGEAELALARAVAPAADGITAARTAGSLADALAAADPLATAVDVFLTEVLVNADDSEARARRFRLVREAAATLAGIADFAQVSERAGER